MSADVSAVDLLAPAERLISVASVIDALRRRRRAILALAILGAVLGLALGTLVPKSRSATATILLEFPPGADPARAIVTDLSLLKTGAVAQSATKSLGLRATPESFLSVYTGDVVSDRVMRITAHGRDAATAVRRTDAVAAAFLGFRKQIYEQQLAVVLTARRDRRADLVTQLSSVTASIQAFDPRTAPPGVQLDDLLSARTDLNNQIQQLDDMIQSDTIATASVVEDSQVLDPARAVEISARRVAAVNAASGFVAGLAIGVLAFALQAVVTTRVRRRSDVAAIMRAPVALSVGSVVPTGWRRLIPRYRAQPDQSSLDLQLIVRHLQGAVATAPAPALVIVAIDSLPVAAQAVQELERQLTADGKRVSIVNESERALPERSHPGGADSSESDPAPSADVVLVLAALDPAKGAEHLREWAATAVAFVTAGRSTATKLAANATMIRDASLHLRSVVLIEAERTDDSLGIFEESSGALAAPRPVGIDYPSSTSRSS